MDMIHWDAVIALIGVSSLLLIALVITAVSVIRKIKRWTN